SSFLYLIRQIDRLALEQIGTQFQARLFEFGFMMRSQSTGSVMSEHALASVNAFLFEFKQFLHADQPFSYTCNFGDADDTPGAIRQALDLHDQVECGTDLLANTTL